LTRPNWSVQDAKNKFSAVVEAAQRAPQTVTKHGRPTAVVISAKEYARLTRKGRRAKKPSFAEMLLAIPQGDDKEDLFERLPVEPRDVDF
jgi:prevent-host-death family protein